jgi:hypothetical protein
MKKIKGFGNKYTIDRKGTVYSNGVPMKARTHRRSRYKRVNLRHKGLSKTVEVHRLVGKTFLGSSKRKSQYNHENGDKNNNSVSNLSKVTPSENSLHARRTGLYGRYVRQHLRKGRIVVRTHYRRTHAKKKK